MKSYSFFPGLFSSCLSVLMFSSMLSVCLYVSASSIWANAPAILPSRRPYSASLSPSNSPSACGRLLPFLHGPWFLPVGVRWLSCVMCIQEPTSSSSLSFAPFSAGAVEYTVQERPCCREALVQIPVHSPPNGNGSLKQERLERVESQWMITGCAVTRGNSEENSGTGEKLRKETQRKGHKEERITEGCEMFWQGDRGKWRSIKEGNSRRQLFRILLMVPEGSEW